MIDSTRIVQSTLGRLAVALGALMLGMAHAGAANAADAASGKALFDKTCANCHSIDAGVNKVGPTLFAATTTQHSHRRPLRLHTPCC